MSPITDCQIIELPKIHDPRGNLTFIEGGKHVAFDISRAYWIYDVPGGMGRGGHAYKQLHELVVAVSGSFDVTVDDGKSQQKFSLNRSYYGLLIPPMVWRSLDNFSTNSLCLILGSRPYERDDYLYDYDEFKALNA